MWRGICAEVGMHEFYLPPGLRLSYQMCCSLVMRAPKRGGAWARGRVPFSYCGPQIGVYPYKALKAFIGP